MEDLEGLYIKLYNHFGPQNWWPAESRFEMMVGAILTQNVNWKNVEIVIARLKQEGILDPKSILKTPDTVLQELIRPSGFYKQKTNSIKRLALAIIEADGVDSFLNKNDLRTRLLDIKGIGPETADSIALYAGDKPYFVVDAYTMRILERMYGIVGNYSTIQNMFHKSLKKDIEQYQEFHALLVRTAKDFCTVKPRCVKCPVSDRCRYSNQKNTSSI